MNDFLAFLQQALGWLGGQAGQAWDVMGAVIAGHTAPARQVALYTVASIVLLVYAPRILKKLTK